MQNNRLSMTTINSTLFIRGLELSVNLGWPDNERKEKQIVQLDIDIFFAVPPKACQSDDLTDTLCYQQLINTIQEKVTTKSFRLIEFLSSEIYQIIKPQLPEQAKIVLRITKHPHIQGLTGHVFFEYGDVTT